MEIMVFVFKKNVSERVTCKPQNTKIPGEKNLNPLWMGGSSKVLMSVFMSRN